LRLFELNLNLDLLNKKHNPPVLLVGPSCAKQVAWW
jgi:hypothetical protein